MYLQYPPKRAKRKNRNPRLTAISSQSEKNMLLEKSIERIFKSKFVERTTMKETYAYLKKWPV